MLNFERIIDMKKTCFFHHLPLLLMVFFSNVIKAEVLTYRDTNNVDYTYDTSTMTATVKAGGAFVKGNIVIPAQIVVDGESYQVTNIGDYAFQNNKDITSIEISEGITAIGTSSFADCSGLNKIMLPNSLISIGNGAFQWCENLVSINLPAGITRIETNTFSACYKLDGIILPSSLVYIGRAAFTGCVSLSSIIIPKSVKNIVVYEYESVFAGCQSLVHIEVEEGNTVYDSRDNCNAIIKTSTNELIIGCKTTIIPQSVKSLANKSFAGTGIKEIVIPSHIEKIGGRAFLGCYELEKVEFQDGLKSIPEFCFGDCSSLKEVHLPSTLESIGYSAFIRCPITHIDFPHTLKNIYEKAFSFCPIEELVFPEGLLKIAEGAFMCCTSLKSIEFPSTLEEIGESAFMQHAVLTSITLPARLKKIGNRAFESLLGRQSLHSVTSLIEEPFELDESVFMNYEHATGLDQVGVFTTASLNIPTGTKGKYKATKCWNQFSLILEAGAKEGEYIDKSSKVVYSYESDWPEAFVKGTNSSEFGNQEVEGDVRILEQIMVDGKIYKVTGIRSSAFSGCIKLTSISMPASITEMGNKVFQDCIGLEKVDMSETGVANIGIRCFSGCEKLDQALLPPTLTSIAELCFENCANLVSISIPETVQNIDSYAFYDCRRLESVTMPNGVLSIGNSVFWGCSALRDLNIPNSVLSIGSEAFYGCSSLYSLAIPNSVTTLGRRLFQYCTNLKQILIPKSVVKIDGFGFAAGCYNLESFSVEEGNPIFDSRDNCNGLVLTAENALLWGNKNTIIPNSVTRIEDGAYSDCENLNVVDIPSQITSVGYGAFNGCTGLTQIILPENLSTIDLIAFCACPNLRTIVSKCKNPGSVFGVFETRAFNEVTLYVPKGTKSIYEEHKDWGKFQKIVEVDNIDDVTRFPRKVVVEEGTGTWCPWCPRGIVGMIYMSENYSDSFIPIAIHVNDEMQTDSYDALVSQKFASYPICIMNRNQTFDPNQMQLEKYYDVGSSGACAQIAMSVYWTDEYKTELMINTTTRFAYDMPDDYRIAYVICENQVGPYDQKNAYANGEYGIMGGFENLGEKVSLLHNHVARYISHVNGTRRTVPEEPQGNVDYKYSYSMDLPSNVDNKDNIEVIVLLINQETMEIENAERTMAKDIRIYDPNYIEDISGDCLISDYDNHYYTLDGRPVSFFSQKKGMYIRNHRKVLIK